MSRQVNQLSPSTLHEGYQQRPFMQSLTSMFKGMSDAEVALAERKKAEWLQELGRQVKSRDEQRRLEEKEKEIEALREELRAQTMRSSADAELAQQLSAAKK